MKTYTNITWPDDPYRTGQQLYRRPVPRLAAFAVLPAPSPGDSIAAAIVYLPLHRTRALAVTQETVAFGFRAVSANGAADLAAVADQDLMQARRHAAILAGYGLPSDLAILRSAVDAAAARGFDGVQQEWVDRHNPSRNTASIFDCQADLPGYPSLEMACHHADLVAGFEGENSGPTGSQIHGAVAALAVDRALAIALLCARHLNRYTWEQTLHTGQIITMSAWDCLPVFNNGVTATVAGSDALQSGALPGTHGDHQH